MDERLRDALTDSVWIRPEGMGAGQRDRMQFAYFRLEFYLDAQPRAAVVALSAADRYRLYVNGRSVCAGPLKGDNWNHFADTVDIAQYLTRGDNAITAQVVSYAFMNADANETGPAAVYSAECGLCFTLRGSVENGDGQPVTLSTGEADWRSMVGEGMEIDRSVYIYAGGGERVDMAKQPEGWRSPERLNWPGVREVFRTGVNPWGEFSPLVLKERSIPLMYEREAAFAAEMPLKDKDNETKLVFQDGAANVMPNGKAVAELDAGMLMTGYLQLNASGVGSKVKIIYAERYFPIDDSVRPGEMRRDDWERGKIEGLHDIVTLAASASLYESFWLRTFRFIRLEVEAGPQGAYLRYPTILATGYPLEIKARIEPEREATGALFDTALRTLERCMHETHEDCPYYEQLQYTLDTRLQMLFTYAVSGDTRMARRVLWDYHSSLLPDGMLQARTPCTRRQVIPAFSLYWIFMLEDYLWQTGDLQLIRGYRPTMDGVLDYFDRHLNGQGLYEDKQYWQFCDWVAEWMDNAGVPDTVFNGPCASHNLVYAQGLQSAARLTRITGREGVAREYEERASALLSALRKACYDADRGMIREGPDASTFTQHAQALGVLTGLLTEEEGRAALRHAMDDTDVLPCTFPWQYTLFRALEKGGMYDDSASIWPQYEQMLDKRLTTLPEMPGDTRSDCHAWSALPLYEFIRMNLGIRPGGIGWETLLIAPKPAGMTRLSGVAPTPRGDVRVAWEMKEGRMCLTATTPAMPVRVELPDGRTFAFDGGTFSV